MMVRSHRTYSKATRLRHKTPAPHTTGIEPMTLEGWGHYALPTVFFFFEKKKKHLLAGLGCIWRLHVGMDMSKSASLKKDTNRCVQPGYSHFKIQVCTRDQLKREISGIDRQDNAFQAKGNIADYKFNFFYFHWKNFTHFFPSTM